MGNVDGCYAADSVALVGGQGSVISSAAEVCDNQVISHSLYTFPRGSPKISFQGRINESSSPNTSKNFL